MSGGLWLGWGRQAAIDWQFRRTIASAEALLHAGDLRVANLAARQALMLKPMDRTPRKLLAAIAMRATDPTALLWQREACECPGASAGDWLDLARMALAFDELPVADEALSRVSGSARSTVQWHEVAGAVAAHARLFGPAEQHFREALRLEPGNQRHALNLASAQLSSADAATAAGAREALAKLTLDPALRATALRNLLSDARTRGQRDVSRELARKLSEAPGSTFDDRRQVLVELRETDEPAFRHELAKLRGEAAGDLASVASLMRWMNAHGESLSTVEWWRELPAPMRAEIAVAMSAAEALAQEHRWDELRGLVSEGEWGQAEFFRHAFRARAIAGDSVPPRGAPFVDAWQRAVVDTRGNHGALSVLARLAESWGWREQAAEVWWFLASRPAGQGGAFKALFSLYRRAGDTPNLYRVARRIRETEPANPVARNNVAMLALLLGRDLPEAHQIAAELREAFPREPGIVSTFALSLVKQDRAAEALRVLDSAPPVPGDDAAELYRAIALAANGRVEESLPVLRRAAENRALLPEERALAASHLVVK